VVERAVLLFDGDFVEPEHLSLGEMAGDETSETLEVLERALSSGFPENGIDFDGLIGNIEMELIDRAMKQSGYNQSKAARLLGIKRDKLRYKVKALESVTGARDGGNST
jgi:DNA-binding NtrC family response regulator